MFIILLLFDLYKYNILNLLIIFSIVPPAEALGPAATSPDLTFFRKKNRALAALPVGADIK